MTRALKQPMGRKAWLILAAALLAPGAAPLDAAQPFSGRLVLTLEGALAQVKDGQVSAPQPLNVYATCDHGAWADAWAEAQTFNRANHVVESIQADVSPGRLKATIRMEIGSDPWIKGGDAVYELDAAVTGETVEGTFTGLFHGLQDFQAKGRVHGLLLPPLPVAPGYKPLAPREHPRLLFRACDLPRLRERMETPFGRAILARLEKSDDPMALGLLYHLTGDKAYADRAVEPLKKAMAERGVGWSASGRIWGYRMMPVAYGYDLFYDAWDHAFRDEVQQYLDRFAYEILFRTHRLGTVNLAPGSNYVVVLYPGAGLGTMAFWGEKGPEPPVPPAPQLAIARLDAPAGFEPPTGVPVERFEPGRMPANWLMAGPFKADPGEDAMADAGGSESVRPEPGMKVARRGETRAFQPLDQKFLKPVGGAERAVDLVNAVDRAYFTTSYYYTVIENDTPRLLRVSLGHVGPGNATLYLAGHRLEEGDFLRLGPGKFPVLVRAFVEECNAWGTIWMVPRLVEATEDQANDVYAKRRKEYARVMKWHRRDHAMWQENDGANVDWMKWDKRCERLNYLNLMCGMGLGGFQGEGEGYTLECHWPLFDYALAFRNIHGRPFPGRPTIGHFVPRYVAASVWAGGTREGAPVAVHQSYGRGGGTPDSKYLARAITLVPEEWKPAVLWYWLKHLGSTAQAMRTEEGVRRAIDSGRLGDAPTLVWTFINYPLDLQPVNPGDVMPRAWEARTRGYYCFRNGWLGRDSIVAQIYAKSGVSCGWNQAEAGCFQIYGLGYGWARKDDDGGYGKEGSRWYDNVVMLPDDPVNAWGRAEVTHYAADPKTGSGVVTFDMSPVYEGLRKTGGKTERYDAGIRGLRSFAADYSGAAGAPGLVAVVDRITGGKKKVWVFQLPPSGRDGPDADCRIDGNTFTIIKGDASLKATFVAPAGVRIEKALGQGAHPLSRVPDAKYPALHATGPDGLSGEFFVVMTIQRGNAPPVKVQGKGLDATAHVGGRTVRFDGKNLVLGK